MFKVNNKDTRKTPLLWFCCLYFYLWAYFTPCSSVSIVNFKHVIAGWFGKWEYIHIKLIKGKFNFSYNEFHLVLVAFYLAHVTITRNLNLIQSQPDEFFFVEIKLNIRRINYLATNNFLTCITLRIFFKNRKDFVKHKKEDNFTYTSLFIKIIMAIFLPFLKFKMDL